MIGWSRKVLIQKTQARIGLGIMIAVQFMINTASAMEFDLTITATSESQLYPTPGAGDQEGHVSSLQLKPDLAVYLGDSTRVVLSPRVRKGVTDSEYDLVSPDDLYLEVVGDLLEFRAGYQIFFWGTVESSNIVDILNQRDFIGDFLNPDKLGEPSARLRFLLGENRFDLYYLPYFTPAPLPGKVNRFNFFDGISDISDDPLYTNSKEEARFQGAIRWDRSIGSSDIGLSYYNGYEKFPVLNQPTAVNVVEPLYYEIQQVSGDLQMSLGEWLIKAEAVYQDTGIAGSFSQNTVLPDGSVIQRDLVPPNHSAFVGGLEYTFFGVMGPMDLGFVVEYLYDSEQDLQVLAFRPFQNDLFLAIRLLRNNFGDAQLLGGVIHDLKTQSQIWRLEYEERYFDRVKLQLSLDRINASSDDPLSVFNNDDRFSIEFSYTY